MTVHPIPVARDASPPESIAVFPNRKLNVREAAAYLGLSPSTLNKLRLASGPRYLKLGRRVLYDLRELEAWAAKNTRDHTSQ
jgi:excisionase family DNA binding protein